MSKSEFIKIRNAENMAQTLADSMLSDSMRSNFYFRRYFKSKKTNKSSYFKRDVELLKPKTFDKLIRRDIQYFVVGEDNPLGGFSLDVSDKAKAKISGIIPSDHGIHAIEIEAGKKNSEVPLVEGGKYNGQIEIKYNWHHIPRASSQQFFKGADHITKSLFKKKQKELTMDMLDSLESVSLLMYAMDSEIFLTLTDYLAMYKVSKADNELADYYGAKFGRADTLINCIRKYKLSKLSNPQLFISLAKKYYPKTKLDSIKVFQNDLPYVWRTLTTFAQDSSNAENIKLDLLFKDFKTILTRINKRLELNTDAEISIAKPFWTTKQYFWITVSPSINYQAFNIYGTQSNGTPVPAKSFEPFFTPQIAIWGQWLQVYKYSARLFRLGADLFYGNNLSEYSEVKYYERDTLLVEQSGNLVIKESVTSGIFRKQETDKKYKLYGNFHAEYYLLPRKNLLPGLNFKVSYLKGGISPSDVYRLRVQIGTILNLLNKEKDKPVISILPYMRYSNVLNEKIKDGDGLRTLTAKEKFIVGITIGLPIKGLTFEKDE
ncbi:hypothetical protein [Dyadobacter sp. 32]|uniref:hypothetical protein n=1 Tax=Dyadobacter sp. 32 TaxID=538966 RepID=UPI0011ECDFE6